MSEKRKQRTTIDTNIVIKMAISKRSETAPKKIRQALDEKRFISITSDKLLTEQRIVLGVFIPQEIADGFVSYFEAQSEKVELTTDSSKILPLVRDVTDTKVMHTAVDGNSDFLVTNNVSDFSKKFPTKEGGEGKVVKPRRFLDILGIKR